MAEQQGSDIKMPDPMEITRSIIQIAGKSQGLVQTFLQRQVTEGPAQFSRVRQYR